MTTSLHEIMAGGATAHSTPTRVAISGLSTDTQLYGSQGEQSSATGSFGVRIARDTKIPKPLKMFNHDDLYRLLQEMIAYESASQMTTTLSVVTDVTQRGTIDQQLWPHQTHGSALGEWRKGGGKENRRHDYLWAYCATRWRPILTALLDIFRKIPLYAAMDFDTAIARIKGLNFNWAFDITKSGELTFFSETGTIFTECRLRSIYTLTHDNPEGTILTECHLRGNNNPAIPSAVHVPYQ